MRVADFLLTRYYSHYKGNRIDIVPTKEQINTAILYHPEKIIIVRDGEIKGIAFFLRLTDATYQRLETLDIRSVEVLKSMAQEDGRHFHCVLMVADGYRTLRIIRQRALKMSPKTVSWWSPDFKRLHRYEVSICHQ